MALPLLVFLVWAPAAQAWSWPVAGPVLQAFSYDEAHPYSAGQHRGIDIGADTAGETVAAPAAGTVSFAGTVPTSGKSVTIETADGYAVTLTHLGSIAVVKGATVAEGDPVGAVGPSGEPEVDGPYVHLGIRVAADPDGYVDPLGLLPTAPETGATDSGSSGSSASQPSSGGTTTTATTSEPARPVTAAPGVATPRGSTQHASTQHASTVAHGRSDDRYHRRRSVQESRTDARARPSSHRPVPAGVHTPRRTATPRIRVSKPMSSSRRPVVETAVPEEPTGLDAGHEIPSSAPVAAVGPPSSGLLPLLCNGVAALVALGAALAAGRRRRRLGTGQIAFAQVLHLSRPQIEHRRAA